MSIPIGFGLGKKVTLYQRETDTRVQVTVNSKAVKKNKSKSLHLELDAFLQIIKIRGNPSSGGLSSALFATTITGLDKVIVNVLKKKNKIAKKLIEHTNFGKNKKAVLPFPGHGMKNCPLLYQWEKGGVKLRIGVKTKTIRGDASESLKVKLDAIFRIYKIYGNPGKSESFSSALFAATLNMLEYIAVDTMDEKQNIAEMLIGITRLKIDSNSEKRLSKSYTISPGTSSRRRSKTDENINAPPNSWKALRRSSAHEIGSSISPRFAPVQNINIFLPQAYAYLQGSEVIEGVYSESFLGSNNLNRLYSEVVRGTLFHGILNFVNGSPICIADLIKHILKETEIISYGSFNKAFAGVDLNNDDEVVNAARENLYAELDRDQRVFLMQLLNHLSWIRDNSALTSEDLAKVFAPLVVKCPSDTPEKEAEVISKNSVDILSICIWFTNYKDKIHWLKGNVSLPFPRHIQTN